MLSNEENNCQSEYQTGSVPPARQAGGIFAAGLFIVFAVLGIFFVTCAIGYRIFTPKNSPVLASLTGEGRDNLSQNEAHMEGEVLTCDLLGITCQSISSFCAEYYNLPVGVYVLNVEKGTPADQQGVLPGDVLIALNDAPIRLAGTLQSYIVSNFDQIPISMLFVRGDQQFYVSLNPEDLK